jgi:hypothetical protein
LLRVYFEAYLTGFGRHPPPFNCILGIKIKNVLYEQNNTSYYLLQI